MRGYTYSMTTTQNIENEWNAIVEAACDDRNVKGFGESAMYRAMISASENADYTAQEVGFEVNSERWCRVAVTGYEEMFNVYSEGM